MVQVGARVIAKTTVQIGVLVFKRSRADLFLLFEKRKKRQLQKEGRNVDNPVEQIRLPGFHAVNFMYKGIEYTFSGWWMLDWGTGEKIYDSKEEFLNDPFFDGRTLEDALEDMTDFDFEFVP